MAHEKASKRNYDLITSKSRKISERSIPVLPVPRRYLFAEEVFMRHPKNYDTENRYY